MKNVKLGKSYAQHLPDEELAQELEFACSYLDCLFKEYRRRAMHGSVKVPVEFEEEAEHVTKTAAAIR